MLCSPAEAVIRPAAPSDPVQQPRNRPSATEVLVEPGVAIRGGYPFGFAPGEKGIDQRVRAGERPQPPCPRIGKLDPGPGEQRAHLSRAAQVDVAGGWSMAQHLGVALSALFGHFAGGARARPHDPSNDPFGDGAVHGQPVGGQLGAEQFGCRLRTGQSARPRTVAELSQPRLLKSGGLRCQLGPSKDPARGASPSPTRPLRPEIAVGLNGVLPVAVVLGVAEQVRWRHCRDRVERQVVQLRPHSGRVGPPPAKEQAMYRGDVPTCRYPHSGTDERDRRLARPPHPSGPQRLLDEANDDRGIPGCVRPREPTRPRRQAEPGTGRVRQADEMSTPDARQAELLHHVRTGHQHNLVTAAVLVLGCTRCQPKSVGAEVEQVYLEQPIDRLGQAKSLHTSMLRVGSININVSDMKRAANVATRRHSAP